MNHFSKPPRTADEHLALLKSRNLEIDESEEIEVKSYLRSIGYFRLSGYFGPLQETKDGFKKGTKFKDILRLYQFDSELRHLTFKALTLVEVEIRARMTDIFSLAHNSFWYEDESLFDLKTEDVLITRCEIQDDQIVQVPEICQIPLYKTLLKEIKRSLEKTESSEFMQHFKSKYSVDSPIPSWMVMESISFGKLSRIYGLLISSPEKAALAKHFGASVSEFLDSWLHSFAILRNMCAHHARLWNKKIGPDIMIPRRKKNSFLSFFDEKYTRKYYGVSSCLLKVLQSIDSDFMIEYKKTFHELITKYDIDLSSMGFPTGYQKDDIWSM